MRILQIISYGYLAGGAEKSVLLLKEELQRRNHEVMIISSDHHANGDQARFDDRAFPEIDSPGTSLAGKMYKHFWYTPSYRAIRQAIADFKPDIVHFHTMGQLSPSALFALGETPGLLTVHGPEEYVSGILEWSLPQNLFRDEHISRSNLTGLGMLYYLYFRFAQRPVYVLGMRKHLKGLIAPSGYMADILKKEKYGSVPIYHIYNGISLPEYQPLQNKRRLLYVGRLEYVKGVDVLLKAMKKVVAQIDDVHLSIVGDGLSRKELEMFVKQNHLENHVTFHGWLEPAAVNDQYAQTTAVVIPSIWPENLPTVCIEALAIGRPVIGTRSGGIPELVQHGSTGSVVAVGDIDELAAAIVMVLLRTDLSAVSKACAASAQQFKVATFGRNLERLYQHIISGPLEVV